MTELINSILPDSKKGKIFDIGSLEAWVKGGGGQDRQTIASLNVNTLSTIMLVLLEYSRSKKYMT